MTLVAQLECSVVCILITKEQQFNNLQFKNVLRVSVCVMSQAVMIMVVGSAGMVQYCTCYSWCSTQYRGQAGRQWRQQLSVTGSVNVLGGTRW